MSAIQINSDIWEVGFVANEISGGYGFGYLLIRCKISTVMIRTTSKEYPFYFGYIHLN